MKNIKRIAALLLALVMTFALCACANISKGKDKGGDRGDAVEKKKTDAELIVGTWEAKVDVGETLNAMMADDPSTADYAQYFNFAGTDLLLTYEFYKDGSYTEKMATDRDKMRTVFRNAVLQLLEDAAVDEGVTLEQLAAESGMTVDDLVDQVMEISFDASNFLGDETKTGSYKIKGGKLYLFDDGDELDEGTYFEYKLKGDKLTIVMEYEDGERVGSDDFYPVDYTRA